MGKNPLQESVGQYQVETFLNGEITSQNFKSANEALKAAHLEIYRADILLQVDPNAYVEIMFHASAPMEEKNHDKKTVNKAV